MYHSLQTPEYNPSSRDRYLSPWIIAFWIRRSMGFFDFSIHTSRGQLRIGQVPRTHTIPSTPTQRTERPIKLPKKGAAAKVYGPFFIFLLWFFHWFLYFSALLYVPWLIFWICSLLKNPIGKHVPRWPKKNIAPEISFQGTFIRWKFDLCPISYIPKCS